jgi:GntR family transcriptional regulator
MKLWLSKNSAVPIQQQLRTQLMLGIMSGDLAEGQKLPSTPEIARRFRLHANTVRAAYRDLVKGQWAEWRRGSGFYVRWPTAKRAGGDELDRLVFVFMEAAQRNGYSLDQIRTRLADWIPARPPDHILVLEPDPELRAILIEELAMATGISVEGADIDGRAGNASVGALIVTLENHATAVRAAIPSHAALVTLKSRSIAASLLGQTRPSADTPITLISGWPAFSRWAHVVLTGVGLDPTAFDIRDARDPGWNRGLTRQSFIVTDALTARRLPQGCQPRVFQIISDQSIEELRSRFPGGK